MAKKSAQNVTKVVPIRTDKTLHMTESLVEKLGCHGEEVNYKGDNLARGAISELTVPLRAAWNVPRNKRASRAVSEIRNQVQRHLKVGIEESVWIDPKVNEHIWKNGIENPPRKVKLQITRHDEEDIPIEVKLFEE